MDVTQELGLIVVVMKGQETIEAHHSLIPTSVNISLQPGMPAITANNFKTARTPLIYTAAETIIKVIIHIPAYLRLEYM